MTTELALEPWIETYTGKHLYFLEPSEDQIDIEDIATALSNECRFGGHTSSFYSVAEHSVLVATLCSKELQLSGLLHDASEAYLRDIASPIKQYLSNYKELETKIMTVIAKKFNLEDNFWHNTEIKVADVMALKAEARQLLPSGGKDWIHLFPTEKEAMVRLRCFTPFEAKNLFMAAFNNLTGTKAVWTPPKSEILVAR